jgi:hypothetical protein
MFILFSNNIKYAQINLYVTFDIENDDDDNNNKHLLYFDSHI